MSAPALHPSLLEIEARLGRPLRVLHVGNIANNAYNNARIQRQHGIEADVLSYDYYHVMSTPEWEDAEFEGSVDSDAPNWWTTSLKGWKRPDWFAQGPADACVQYLKARRMGLNKLAKLLWVYLEARSLGHVRHLQAASGTPLTQLAFRHLRAISIVEGLGLDRVPSREAFGPTQALENELLQTAEPASGLVPTEATKPSDPGWRRALRPVVRGAFSVYYGLKTRLVVSARRAKRAVIGLAGNLGASSYRSEAARLQGWRDDERLAARDVCFQQRYDDLVKEAGSLEKQEADRLLKFAREHPRRFFRILYEYDVVQLYSIDGFISFMNGQDGFAAYEHGTLREMPFATSFYGVLARCAYRDASLVFVTNSDVLDSVERMGLDPARIICLPHAFDDRKLTRFLAENPDLRPPPGPPVIFSPTRQHWKDRSGSWTKGNDVLYRAAALVAAEGHDFRLHLVEWGKEIDESKALLTELGIADKVVWLPTMQKRQLWAAYCTAHAVADQFILPALGGVGFEAMVLGRRLITAIDEGQLAHFFGEAPPCLVSLTVEQCAVQLRRVIADPGDRQGLGVAAQDWMLRYHSADRIVALQIEAYAALQVEKRPSSSEREVA